jgi:hypothetical protein
MFEEVYLQNIGSKFGPICSTKKYTEIQMGLPAIGPTSRGA